MNNLQKAFQNPLNNNVIASGKNNSKTINRIEEWKSQAAFYDDKYLNKLKEAMLKVFCEEASQTITDKEMCLYVNDLERISVYSDDIRQGLAIELALIGNNSDLLINCSPAYRESFVDDIIHDTFEKMTWNRLVMLKKELPFLAEASPDAFLKEIALLTTNKTIVQQLLDDENGIIRGGFPWIGFVPSLETLAWEPEYLTTVISILTNHHLFDHKKSNLHPRSKDILLGLFWPWKPQTMATETKLIMAASFLFLQNKDFAWEVLSDSIERQLGSNHRHPLIRNIILPDKGNECSIEVNRGKRLIQAYKKTLLTVAESDVSMVPHMVRDIHLFMESDNLKKVLTILSSSNVTKKKDKFKEPIWTGLQKFCIKNRVYNDMNWSLSEDNLQEIDHVISLLKPKSLLFQVKYLFDTCTSDWYESKNYLEEEQKFVFKRKDAIKTIYAEKGLDGIIELSQLVNNPTLLGAITSISDIKLDNDRIIFLLDDQKKKIQEFICGYLSQSYDQWKDEWLSTFRNVNWNVTQKVSFLICLSLSSSVCHFAETWLKEKESLFWKDCQPRYIPSDDKDRYFVVQKALKYNRPDIAVAIFSWLHYEKGIIDFDSCAKALIELAKTNQLNKFKHWEITHLIVDLQAMQKNDKQKSDLMQIEFSYLSLLDSNLHKGLSPATLYSALAEDPTFFHQVISYAYKSEIPGKTLQVNDDLAKNAFSLMFQWNRIPGIINGAFDYDVFMKWYKKSIELCKESGHLRVAQSHIGETLFHAPKDRDGFWIDKRIAALLDKKENDALRNGYHCAAYNSRGVRVVDFSGKREHDEAEEQIKKAEDLEKKHFPNFAGVFRDLAKLYEEESKRAIKEGERFKRQRAEDDL